MIKSLFDIKNKTKGYTDKMLVLVDKINQLQQKGITTEIIFAHLNQYIDLMQKDKTLQENIQNINQINQAQEEKRVLALQKEGSAKIAEFFKNNGASYSIKSASPSELVEIFKEQQNPEKFRQGIHFQEEKLNAISNEFYKIIKHYQLNGDTIVNNFSLIKGYQEKFKFGLANEFIKKENNSNIYSNLYSIQQSYANGFFANEYSILMLCARFGMNKEIEYLIKEGCDIHYMTNNGKMAKTVYQPNKLASEDEINYIKSLLDGTYKNGIYVTEYENKRLEKSITTPNQKNNNNKKIKV